MAKTISALCLVMAWIAAANGAIVPLGELPDTITPKAYRLDLTVDPSKAAFRGRTQIDAELKQSSRSLFLHGLGLRVSRASITTSAGELNAVYAEVDESGVARLDFDTDIPAGSVTLRFDYEADFATGAEGLFRAQVAGDWYAWTQMAPIDARRMFPCFDEPRFKTPFTIRVTAPGDLKVFANTPETRAVSSEAMITHHFRQTQPLPTYLIAIGVGPFDVVEQVVPANEVRSQPLPVRVIATKGQKQRMQIAAAESPKLLTLIEQYVQLPYPYEKLDMLATPILGGAMENAGLIVFDDTLLLLDSDAPFKQLRLFAEVMAHEIAHQWFGNLVTPVWWTDVWLSESFAEWLGKRIAHQWRPDLGIGSARLEEAFNAMAVDSLPGGRPIRQPIVENRQIASAFDLITYQKGAQVVAMFETYLGETKFADGLRLHLKRYRHANASAEDFFRSLSEAAGDPKLVAAMRTFVDQTGVPLVSVTESPEGMVLSQSRYRPVGIEPGAAQTWVIPVCLSRGERRTCKLLDTPSARISSLSGSAPLMPNADGAGYYRFRLDGRSWDRLIADARSLPGIEALALADSTWADFAAGTGSFERVVNAAHALSTTSERLAVIELGYRLTELARSVLEPDQVPGYRALMQSIYGARLAALGLDLRPGAHATEAPAVQALRQSLVPLAASEGRDAKLRAQLSDAAAKFIDGDTNAIDPAFRAEAFIVGVQDRGADFMRKLSQTLVASIDPLLREQASAALGSANTVKLAELALELSLSKGMQSFETVRVLINLSRQPEARQTLVAFVDKNFERLMDSFPTFLRPEVVRMFDDYCSPSDVAMVDAYIQPKLPMMGGGELELAQTKQRIGVCVALRSIKGPEIGTVLDRAERSSSGPG